MHDAAPRLGPRLDVVEKQLRERHLVLGRWKKNTWESLYTRLLDAGSCDAFEGSVSAAVECAAAASVASEYLYLSLERQHVDTLYPIVVRLFDSLVRWERVGAYEVEERSRLGDAINALETVKGRLESMRRKHPTKRIGARRRIPRTETLKELIATGLSATVKPKRNS
jgi:hypothetical protein